MKRDEIMYRLWWFKRTHQLMEAMKSHSNTKQDDWSSSHGDMALIGDFQEARFLKCAQNVTKIEGELAKRGSR